MTDDIVTRLRGAAADKYGCNCVKCEAADEIERLRAERDEARRLVCAQSYDDPRGVARQLGWDCFKETKQ
jgi:hypothetical protein